MDSSTGVAQIQEIQESLRAKTANLAETAAHIGAAVQRKADLGDVQRLQHVVGGLRVQQGRQTQQLLAGTRRVACDRELPPDQAVGTDAAYDLAKAHQQEELWREVQTALADQK